MNYLSHNNADYGDRPVSVKYLSEATQRAIADRRQCQKVCAQDAIREEKMQQLARRAPTTFQQVLRPAKSIGSLPKPYPHHLV